MKNLLINSAYKSYNPRLNKYLTLNKIGFSKSFIHPIGLLYIAKFLKNEGYKVKLIDFYNEEKPAEKMRKSLSSLDVIRLGVYKQTRNKSVEITKIIKNIDSDVKIIISGPNCVYFSKQSLKDTYSADIYVEAEWDLIIKDVIFGETGGKIDKTI